jgi:hypothetical protein
VWIGDEKGLVDDVSCFYECNVCCARRGLFYLLCDVNAHVSIKRRFDA